MASTQTVSGTFETAGTTPIIGQVYTITSISGSVNGEAITGLNNVTGANTFKWNGSPSSIVTNNVGIHYNIGAVSWNLYCSDCGFFGNPSYKAANSWNDSIASTGLISSSSLSPVSPPAGVPGPLPLFGAVAAFGWSRRLRRRVHPAR
jgi:hypothetical protein